MGVVRWGLTTLLLCSAIQKSESFKISKRPSNPTTVVLGVNSDRVRLEWRYSDAPSSYFVEFWRQKPGEPIEKISSSKDGNAFNPSSTSEFNALLAATLILKNVKRNVEYTYHVRLLDTNAKLIEQDTVTINVVVPPTITQLPEPKPLFTIRQSYTLTCNASGDPLPNITWTKDGIPVDKFNVRGYQLRLINVRREDVGSYRCTASNGYGDDATIVSIVGVRCKDCDTRMVELTLQSETWKSALNNKASIEFKTLQANLLSEISSVYTKIPGKQLYTMGLVELRAGSVVAIVELKFGKYVTDPLKPLEDEIRDGKLGSFTVDRELHLPSTTAFPLTNTTASAFPFTNATATAFPFTNVTSTAIPSINSTASDQSDDRKKHQNMLHAIYLTILFLLVVIIIVLVFVIWRGRSKQGALKQTGNLKYHRQEHQTDIRGQESPPELQLIGCSSIQGELVLTNKQSLKLPPQSSGNEG